MSDDLTHAAHTLASRTAATVGRGVLHAVADEAGLQSVQVELYRGEVRQADRVQPYGLTSVPLAGCDVIVVCPGGGRQHPVVIAIDDESCRRAGLAPGEVCLYAVAGSYVHLKADGTVEIKAPGKVVIDSPRVEITGDLVDRTGAGNGRTVQGMREVYDRHTHPDPQGGATSRPGETM